MKFTKTLALASVALGAALVSGSASAVSYTLDSGGSNTNNNYGNVRGFPTGTLSASAWSNTGNGSTIETAYLSQYSGGLGVCDRAEGICPDAPNHSTDNSGKTDSVLFSFAATVNLASVTFGWVGGNPADSDFSVLYYTGANPMSLSGTYGNLLTSGWSLLGNYNGGNAIGTTNVGTGAEYSQYWLVSAYNSAFGTATGLDGYDDYFKIKGLTANERAGCTGACQQNNVPEPQALMLLGFGLLGLGLSRRRK